MQPTDQPWYVPLRTVARQLNAYDLPYCVVGGIALALHGIPIQTFDIDIETNRDGAYFIENLFQDYVTLPVAWRSGTYYRSYLGRLNLDGVQVEIMGQIERQEGGVWVSTATTTVHTVMVQDVPVRVPWLEEEVLANMRRGRLDRASESLKYCDPQRMLQLIRGIVHTNVV
ncbi:MAG: hypothetical protein GXP41_05655 [Chloroflexi bacterium]|nr:hypothetical protein [Chloroflexota bacterium]